MAPIVPDQTPRFWERATTAVERVAIKSITTGNFGWFVVLAISLGCLWKLDSKDLKEVLLKVLVTYGWMGYVVAGIVIYVAIKVLRWRERFYQQEMARISEVRNRLMQTQFELPMASSVEKENKI